MSETVTDNGGREDDLLDLQVQELKAKVLELQIKNEALVREVNQLKNENNQLKRPPLFVAVVIDVLESGEVYLRQQGNNQEYITQVSDSLRGKLRPGIKVAVNNALSVVRVVGSTFDPRVRVMEIDEAPSITFDQVGGLSDEIEEVREAVEYPITRPELYRRVGIEPPKGVLLYGPPGTGKTLIARAVAHHAQATFIRMSGSELVHKFIGEGAQLVRELFTLARSRAPAIVFIDEIDAIGSMRIHDGTSGSAEVQRTLMQLLAEMDGFENRGNVRVIAATNRVDMLDPALLRPGRFDRHIEIKLPDKDARREIFEIHSAKMNIENLRIDEIVEQTEGATGADIEAICREAGMMAVRRGSYSVTHDDLMAAISKVLRKSGGPDARMYV
ncbi:MAG: proteasome-activating nucleotidase [Methanoculleaceae archaeon]